MPQLPIISGKVFIKFLDLLDLLLFGLMDLITDLNTMMAGSLLFLFTKMTICQKAF